MRTNETILGLFGPETVYEGVPDLSGLLRVFTDSGGTLIETGFPEFGPHAEKRCNALQKALAAYRNKTEILINVAVNQFYIQADLYELLNQKLKVLGLTYADTAVFGPVSGFLLEQLKENGFAVFLEDVLEKGIIKNAGIWLHDRVEYVETAAGLSPSIKMLRFEYSPLDFIDWPGAYTFVSAGRAGLVPIAGGIDLNGRLVRHLPPKAAGLWRKTNCDLRLKEKLTVWAVQEAKEFPVILSAKTPEELGRLYDLAEYARGTKMPVRDQLLRNNLRDALREERPVPCTACGCCMPCDAAGIDIPGILALYNDAILYEEEQIPIYLYHLLGHDRKQCIGCGQCYKYCPRRNNIPEIMEYTGHWWQ